MTTLMIKPDFKIAEPVASDFVSFRDMPGEGGDLFEICREAATAQAAQGAAAFRFTLTGPGTDGHPSYPPGLWVEGWKDVAARQLPFGEADETGVMWPPLTRG